MLYSEVKKILKKHQKSLTNRGVKSLAIFGSTALGKSSKKSDVDILIDFEAKKGLFEFVDTKLYLEEILGCEVDLVSKRALHPHLKNKIILEAKNVF
ncbi:MAG: nucleotidyltransferase family protein [Chlamydiia bacterium]|nr:nucleotidyltransferase family protein [Chlamydiia bacterium]